jgi:hypothetical protein
MVEALETRVVLLHVAASFVKPFQNIRLSRNTTFACRKASTNITNPPGVAQTYSLRTPTVFFAFAGSCAQK